MELARSPQAHRTSTNCSTRSGNAEIFSLSSTSCAYSVAVRAQATAGKSACPHMQTMSTRSTRERLAATRLHLGEAAAWARHEQLLERRGVDLDDAHVGGGGDEIELLDLPLVLLHQLGQLRSGASASQSAMPSTQAPGGAASLC